MRELNNLVRNQDFQPIISQTFQSRNLTSSQFLHFISLSRMILQQESDLRDYFIEQEDLFIELQNDLQFRQQICLIHNYYRQANAHRRSHPYCRLYDTGSSASLSNSARSMREIRILDMEAPVPASPIFSPETSDALLTPLAPPAPPSLTTSSPPTSESYRTVNDRTIQTGTQEHPIVIEELEEDWRCTWCNQHEHDYEDCNTLIQVPSPCATCAWKRQQICNHYLITPAWTCRQQEIITRQGWKTRLPWVTQETSIHHSNPRSTLGSLKFSKGVVLQLSLFSLMSCSSHMLSTCLPHCRYMPSPYAAVAMPNCATHAYHTDTLCFPASHHDDTEKRCTELTQKPIYLVKAFQPLPKHKFYWSTQFNWLGLPGKYSWFPKRSENNSNGCTTKCLIQDQLQAWSQAYENGFQFMAWTNTTAGPQ